VTICLGVFEQLEIAAAAVLLCSFKEFNWPFLELAALQEAVDAHALALLHSKHGPRATRIADVDVIRFIASGRARIRLGRQIHIAITGDSEKDILVVAPRFAGHNAFNFYISNLSLPTLECSCPLKPIELDRRYNIH
jgi:hypothetical protein